MTSQGNDSRGLVPLRGTFPTLHPILGKGVITMLSRYHRCQHPRLLPSGGCSLAPARPSGPPPA